MNKIIQKAWDLKVADIAKIVLEDPRFPIWSGSSKEHQHHYGKGGLERHTREVIDFCLINNNYHKKVEEAPLFLAALFHDCGKMWDYKPKDDDYIHWEATEHKYKIHHLNRSVIVWNNGVDKFPEYEKYRDEVTHAILSHHGLREWGSPVRPQTPLAWILHLSDSLSARLDDLGAKQ